MIFCESVIWWQVVALKYTKCSTSKIPDVLDATPQKCAMVLDLRSLGLLHNSKGYWGGGGALYLLTQDGQGSTAFVHSEGEAVHLFTQRGGSRGCDTQREGHCISAHSRWNGEYSICSLRGRQEWHSMILLREMRGTPFAVSRGLQKTGKKVHEYTICFRKIAYFLTIIFYFMDFSQPYLMIKIYRRIWETTNQLSLASYTLWFTNSIPPQ